MEKSCEKRAVDPAVGRTENPARPSDEQSDFPADVRVRLSAHFRAHGLDFDPSDPIARLSGGLANRNYLATVDGRRVVLRRPPDGPLPPGSHNMARENMILSRLSRALPFIPDGLHYCEDTSVIGVPFQLIEYRAGLVIRGDDMSPIEGRPGVPPRLCEMLLTTLATLHKVDPASVGLDGIGRPEGFIARAITGWARRGALVSEGLPIAKTIGAVVAWLEGRTFQPRPPTLLHCDFKLDNIILDEKTLQPVALIDWDMGTRGDPLFDLATLLSYWAEPGDPVAMLRLKQMPTAQPGFWSRAKVTKRYAELTGRPVEDIQAMHVLAMLKLGIVFFQLHRQWSDGAVDDPRYADFGAVGEDLVLLAETTTRPSGGLH